VGDGDGSSLAIKRIAEEGKVVAESYTKGFRRPFGVLQLR